MLMIFTQTSRRPSTDVTRKWPHHVYLTVALEARLYLLQGWAWRRAAMIVVHVVTLVVKTRQLVVCILDGLPDRVHFKRLLSRLVESDGLAPLGFSCPCLWTSQTLQDMIMHLTSVRDNLWRFDLGMSSSYVLKITRTFSFFANGFLIYSVLELVSSW